MEEVPKAGFEDIFEIKLEGSMDSAVEGVEWTWMW
jgi:hypothetical protein